MKNQAHFLAVIIILSVNFSQAQELPCKEQYYNKRCKERYAEDANGQIHGKRISYLENGQVDKVAYYNHGKLNGTVTENFSWGKTISTYLNGVENGLYQKIENDGKILSKGNYTNGVQTGYWISNQGLNKGNFVNGKEHGAWEFYMEGWETIDGGIAKGNFNNGKFNGTWINVVVIGSYRDDGRGANIASSTKNYEHIAYRYMKGYKAVFENGVYIQGFDDKGTDLSIVEKNQIEAEKRKQIETDSIRKDEEEKTILTNPSLIFLPDSYYLIDSEKNKNYLIAFSNSINKRNGNDSIKITIVGNTKNISNVSDEDEKGFYVLSLNRATSVQKILNEAITNKNVSYECIGLGNKDSGYDETKGNAGIFVNQDMQDKKDIYNQLKSSFGIEASESFIDNVELLKLKLWNIYMKVYGVESAKIIKNIPIEFITGDMNIHVKNAINEVPAYMQQIDAGQISIDNYKKMIQDKLSKINSENFNKEIAEPILEHKKKNK